MFITALKLARLQTVVRAADAVTATHMTGSATLGRKQFYYAAVTMAPAVATCRTGLWMQQIILNYQSNS